MNYRKLSYTELEVSEICLGTWAMGNDFWGEVDDRNSIGAIHEALDQGINFIDTAPAYGAGHAEEVVGRAIQGRRNRVILGTKTGVTRTKTEFIRDLRPETIRREIDESLHRLRTDYIDLYQIHWPDVDTPLEESLHTLLEIQKQGKFRYLGVSNFSTELMERARRMADIVSLQPHYSLLQRKIERDTLTYCRQHDIGLITYGTLAGGLLTGKYRKLPDFDQEDKRGRFYDYYKPEIWAHIQGLLKIMDGLAESHNCNPEHIAIAWALQQPGITSVLVGAKTAAQACSNALGSTVRLRKEELEQLDTYVQRELSEVVY